MAKRNHGGYDTLRETEFNQAVNINEEANKDDNQQILAEGSETNAGLKETSSGDQVDQPITKMVIIELMVCILSFFGRGMVLGSVGPTLIDLREIASLTVAQGAWIFVSQLAGNFIGSLIAKRVFQELNNEFALSMFMFFQAVCSSLIPAFKSSVLMCLLFLGQGTVLGVQAIGVCAICIRIGGKKRNGMFLQTVYLFVSLGCVVGPIVARPFLSQLAREKFHIHNHHFGVIHSNLSAYHDTDSIPPAESVPSRNSTISFGYSNSSNLTSLSTAEDSIPTKSRVHLYYLIVASVLSVPAVLFFLLYWKSGDPIKNKGESTSQSTSLSFKECTTPLSTTILLLFIQSMLYFGTEETYGNLLTTFAVLGPLHFSKADGAYAASVFWAAMCFGRLNGIWIARVLSPFKMLMFDLIIGSAAAVILVLFAAKSAVVLWCFSAVLGISFATVTGAKVSWTAKHLPGNNYILSVIMTARCAGSAIIAPSVSVLFNITGPMTLMYSTLTALCSITLLMSIVQSIVTKFGVDSKLYNKSETSKLKSEEERLINK